jgi:hypothetical protein
LHNGAKVAVVPVKDTIPETKQELHDPFITVNDAVVIVKESIGSLKVAAIFWLKGTPVALFMGFVELTDGVVITVGEVIPTRCSQPAIIMPSSSGINHILE